MISQLVDTITDSEKIIISNREIGQLMIKILMLNI